MTTEYDWTKRVQDATAGSMYEQLKSVARDARETIAELAGMVRDQAALISRVEERTSAVEAAVREELARFRLEIAAERRTAIEELAASNSAERDALTTANAAFVEDVRKLTDGFNDSMEIVRAEIESVESKVSARIEELRAHIDGQRPAAPTDAQASDKQSGDDVTLIFG